MANTNTDRLQITTVAYDDIRTTEVFWARSSDIITSVHEGSFLLHEDGSASFKCWTDNGVPLVLHVLGNRIVVAATEDVNTPPDPDTVVFDSKGLVID